MTTTDEDIYKHLEHFGVQGMRWGHRNAAPSTTSTSKSTKGTNKPTKKPRTPEQQAKRQAKVRAGVAVGKLALATTAAVLGIVAANQRTKMNRLNTEASMKRINDTGASFLRNMNTQVPYSQVRSGFAVGGAGARSTVPINRIVRGYPGI